MSLRDAMAPELAAFLRYRTADFEAAIAWLGGEVRLQLRGFLTVEPPPDALVLSGRALVIDDARVLVVRDVDGEHVLPGGRREAGESALDAARREVIEETGWSIADPQPFSVVHLHYETPEPTGVGRILYPDFLWHVFVARPGGHDPAARHTDGPELGAEFHPIADVLERPILPYQRTLLAAAWRTAVAAL